MEIPEDVLWEYTSKLKITTVIASQLLKITNRSHFTQLKSLLKSNEQRIEAIIEELKQFGASLNQYGKGIIVLENSAICLKYHPCKSDFDFHDVDILIQPSNLEQAVIELNKLGYFIDSQNNLVNPNSNIIRERISFQKQTKDGLREIHLQHTLVARRYIIPWGEPQIDKLFERSVALKWPGLRVLNQEDFLLQLCLHASGHTYFRSPGIRLYLDIHWYLNSSIVNWEKFVYTARESGSKNICYIALKISKLLLQTPIPTDALNNLEPGFIATPIIKVLVNPEKLVSRLIKAPSFFQYTLLTLLSFDSIPQLFRAFIPSTEWMKKQYTIRKDIFLPYFHFRRWMDLAFRRMNT